MRKHVHTTSANGSDTARDVGHQARNALPAVSTAGSDMIPAGNFLSRAIYTTSYGVSYGMIFPVLLIAHAVPSENALVHGIADGANAARTRSLPGWARKMGLRVTSRKRAKRVMRTGNPVPTKTERRFQSGSGGKALRHAAAARRRVPPPEVTLGGCGS